MNEDNKYKEVVRYIFDAIDAQPDVSVWTDSNMILTDIPETFKALVKVFDLLGLDFTTGNMNDNNPYEPYYLCFE